MSRVSLKLTEKYVRHVQMKCYNKACISPCGMDILFLELPNIRTWDRYGFATPQGEFCRSPNALQVLSMLAL